MNADDADLVSSILLLEEIQVTLLTLSRQRALNRERRLNREQVAWKVIWIPMLATPFILIATVVALFGAAFLLSAL